MRKACARAPGFIVLSLVLAYMLLACCPCAFALDPALDVSQYAHTVWKIRDGFFKGQTTSVAQTPDGYLWLATEFGLLRFDGVRTVPWEAPPNQRLPSTFISNLLVSRDGTLWIGTEKGLASWKDGKLTQYAELAGRYISRLLEDHEGSVWASGGGIPTGRLCAIQNGSARCFGDDGSLGHGVFGLYEDSKGNLWAGVTNGLWRWKPGPPRFYPVPDQQDGIQGFGEGDDGALLIGTVKGIRRFVDGKIEAYPLPGTVPQFDARKILRDRDGGLWIGTSERGLVHVHQGRTDVFAPLNGLSGGVVYTLFEDREDNIWLSTINGLDRFRDYAVPTFSVNQGLSSASVSSVLAAHDGSVWLGTRGGLERWNNGEVTTYRIGIDKQDGKSNGLLPNSLFQDDRGRIWVSTQRAFGYFENGRFVSISGVPGGNVTSIAQDTSGNLWIANEYFGLFHLIRGSEIQQIPWSALGHKDHASVLTADRLHGGLWLGFLQGGVSYFADGRVRASYGTADGLGDGRVNHLRADRDGTLWASTEGGLSRLKDGHIATLTSKNGLPCDTVHWSMDDNAHSVWLYTACGLVRLARPELDAWVAAVDKDKGAKQTIQATVFDSSDGIRSLAIAGHYSPQVAKSSDGKLWFLPWDGVSVIDPRHLPFNKLPPPVHVEQITADRKAYDTISDGNTRLRLPPLVRDLEIDYTALSFVVPEKVLFRYKLEGWDSDWQDVGNRRQAFYTNLSPRNYRFRVTASNNSGVWNEAGTFLDFSVAPAYYQTNWFRAACVMAFMAMLWGLYRLRVSQLAQQFNMTLEARLSERTRIARDLHDTLLQSFHGLLLRFQTVSNELPPGNTKQKLDSAIDQAAEAITEGRDAVQELRSSTMVTNDLAVAISALGQEIAAAETSEDSAVFRVTVEGTPRNLHPILRDEVYRIAAETIRNAFKHAHARQIEVEIRYDERQFRVRVRDDGKGIDPTILSGDGRAGHFGLHGIHERAELIGGKVTVWSERDSGMEVELTIPASRAYTAPSAVRRSRLAEKLSGKFSGKGTAMKS